MGEVELDLEKGCSADEEMGKEEEEGSRRVRVLL
jgi:hypothetical protein